MEKMAALPGVERAGAIDLLPLANFGTNGDFNIEGRQWPNGRSPLIDKRRVRGDYFQTMGIRLVRGRLFDARDTGESPKVVLINDTAANRFWQGEDPVGKRITFFGSNFCEIVGVVASVRSADLSRVPAIEEYGPHIQYPENSMTVVVRTRAEPTALTASIRQEI